MANSKDHSKQPVNRRLSSLVYIAVAIAVEFVSVLYVYCSKYACAETLNMTD